MRLTETLFLILVILIAIFIFHGVFKSKLEGQFKQTEKQIRDSRRYFG